MSDFNAHLAWCYYGLLVLIAGAVLQKWPELVQLYRTNLDSQSQTSIPVLNQVINENNHDAVKNISGLAPRVLPILRYAAITIVIFAMGSTIVAAPSNAQLSITLLNVGPVGKPAQGEAIYLKANIVQVVGEIGKSFPVELKHLLETASPSLLLVTPAAINSKLSKVATTSTILPSQSDTGSWQIIQPSLVANTTINSTSNGWNVTTE